MNRKYKPEIQMDARQVEMGLRRIAAQFPDAVHVGCGMRVDSAMTFFYITVRGEVVDEEIRISENAIAYVNQLPEASEKPVFSRKPQQIANMLHQLAEVWI